MATPYYWGQPGLSASNAPIIPVSAINWRNDPGMTNEAGGQVGGYTGWTAQDPYGGMGENWWFGGTQDAPELFIKGDGKYSGMRYGYTRQGDNWVPGAGTPTSMGTSAYGSDVWGPALITLGGYFGGNAAFGGAGAGAEGAAVGAADGLTSAAPAAAAPTTGGGTAAATGGAGGLFGTGLTGGQAVQLGSLAYGLLGGGGGGSGSGGGGGSGGPVYSGAPMAPLASFMGQRPMPQMQQAAPIDPRTGARDMWNAYSQGLLGPQMPAPQTPQPTLKPGSGLLATQQPVARPVNRTGGYY